MLFLTRSTRDENMPDSILSPGEQRPQTSLPLLLYFPICSWCSIWLSYLHYWLRIFRLFHQYSGLGIRAGANCDDSQHHGNSWDWKLRLCVSMPTGNSSHDDHCNMPTQQTGGFVWASCECFPFFLAPIKQWSRSFPRATTNAFQRQNISIEFQH